MAVDQKATSASWGGGAWPPWPPLDPPLVSIEMGNIVRVQFPVPDIYFGM